MFSYKANKLIGLFFLISFSCFINTIASICNAQTSQFVDSISDALNQKTYFTAFWGTRNAFIANRRAEMTGYNIGVDFGKNLTIGGGFNLLTTPLMESSYININNILLPVVKKWNINYMGYFIEYTFYNTGKWKFTIPVQAGWGFTYLTYKLNNELIREKKRIMLIYEPTMSGTYRITRYFGVGLDVGYRIVINKNKAIGKLTSPIYVLSFKIFYSRIYNDIKTKFAIRLP